MEKIYLEEFDFKGIDALSNQAALPKGFFDNLLNVVKSKSGTLRKREGFQQEGQPISSSEVTHLDRYVTSEVETIITASDGKIFYRTGTPPVSTVLNFHLTAGVSGHSYDSINKIMTIKLVGTNPFIEGDNIYATVGGVDFIWTVEVSTLTTVLVSQVLTDLTSSINGVVLYGGRVSDTLPVTSSTGINVNDMISYEGISRHFKVISVPSSTSIQIDEEIYFNETSTSTPDVVVSERWTQFMEASGSIQDEVIFDSSSDSLPISSSMLRKNMFMTNGSDEPLFFDGADVERLGFHEVPPTPYIPVGSITAVTVGTTAGNGYAVGDILEITQTGASGGTVKVSSISGGGATGPVTAVTLECGSFGYTTGTNLASKKLTGAGNDACTITITTVTTSFQRAIPCSYTGLTTGLRSYKICYERTDNNGEIVQSGFTYKFDYTNPAGSGCLIPIVAIPKGVNKNLLYNIDKCYVDLYRTSSTDVATFYKTIQTPMKTFTNFHISGIAAPSGVTSVITLAGNPTITDLVVGTYIMLLGFKDKNNNGVFKISSFDNAAHTITVYKAAGTLDGTGTNIKGVGFICLRDNSIDDILLTYNEESYTNNANEENNEAPPIANTLTTWDNKLWMLNLKSYQTLDLSLSSIYGDTLSSGDFIEIYKNSVSAPNLLSTYEFVTTGAASSGNIRISTLKNDGSTAITDAEELVRTIGQVINSKADGIFYASYGDTVSGNGRLILTERQRSIDSYIVRIKVAIGRATMLSYILKDGLAVSSTGHDANFYWVDLAVGQSIYSSRIAYSKDQKPASFVGPLASGATELTYFEDIVPENGQEIICARPLATVLVVFKEDSCYRLTKNSDASYLVEIIDTEVGCIAPRSAVCIGDKIIFVSRTGIFSTDGYKCTPIGDRMLRNWQQVDKSFVYYASAFHYTKERQYIVSLPFKDVNQDSQETNNYAFCYDYSEDHWSMFSNYTVTSFCKIRNDVYLANYSGQIFKIRILEDETDFRDDSEAITSLVDTRWIDLDNKSGKKLFQYLVSHLFQSTAPCSAKVYFATDFGNEFKYLGEVIVPNSPWGQFTNGWGVEAWGTKSLEKTRHPLNPQRCSFAKFRFTNENIDEVLELQGFTIEGKQLNTEGVPQIKE